jgi:tRNA(Ile)-lysidine synthase
MKRGAGSGVIQRFLAFLDAYCLSGQAVGVAFSGGPDSTALAICAIEARNASRLAPTLVHVDHGVRADSADDRAIVRETARTLSADLSTVDLTNLSARSTEAEMREARYVAIYDALAPLGIEAVLTGHHARDQAETVLLHLARGQGLEGATGMSPSETLRFGSVTITAVRPFLGEDPVALSDLVTEYGLHVVEDPTNLLVDRARNLVRHHVLPTLGEINPGVVHNISRSAEILRAEDELINDLATVSYRDAVHADGVDGSRLATEAIAIQRRVLRRWVESTCGLQLSFDRTEALRQLAISGSGNVVLELGEGCSAHQIRRRITLHRND